MGVKKPFMLHIFDDRMAFERTADGSTLVLSRSVRDSALDAYVDDRGRVLKEYQGGQMVPLDAIFGIYHLLSGPYVALITESEPAVSCDTLDFRKVTKVAMIPLVKSGVALSEERQADEDKYLELLHHAISAHAFYFSYTCDVTHTLQRMARFSPEERRKPLWQRADDRFFWNKDLVTELMAAKAHDWIVPVMCAHLEFRRNCSLNVYRFTMRGIDDDGHVANFVETEQALLHEDGRQTSFVQIRGSMPLHWSSPVCMKYTPKVLIGPDDTKSVLAARKHVDQLIDTYGPLGVIFVNLVDMKKDQQRLGIKFKEVVEKLERRQQLRYIWFDFHHECRKMQYGNLNKLIKECDDDFHKHLYFARAADGTVTKLQKGVVRTNCLDNLDRTNVVQSLFGRRSLLLQLDLPPGVQANVLESSFTEFEKVFKDVWGNNADAISTYYSGTGALKTDFTRTGKRTFKGLISDACNSVARYYKNNFIDGVKQDSIDLLLGRYRPDPAGLSPFAHPPADQETLGTFWTKIFVVLIAIFSVLMLVRPKEKALQKLFLLSFGLTMFIFMLMIFNLVKKGGKMGKRLVGKPRLLPEAYLMAFYG